MAPSHRLAPSRRLVPAALLAIVTLALTASSATAQICNNVDPESGGLLLSAFTAGSAKVCLSNVSSHGIKMYHNLDGSICKPATTDVSMVSFVYLAVLLWCFMGVSVIADVFMEAIIVITSKTKMVYVKDTSGEVETQRFIKIWNPTVANLTLMALGSSAPEILLSVIEILNNNWYSGALGPSTIVGSAAFNLFCIVAICVSCIPEGQTRRVEQFGVFLITGSFSIFAYVWLLLILVVFTPNLITVLEGGITFGFFFVLVIGSYMADLGIICGSEGEQKYGSLEEGDDKTLDTMEVARLMGDNGFSDYTTSPDEVAESLFWIQKTKTRAEYRINAGRTLQGGKPLFAPTKKVESTPGNDFVGFQCQRYRVAESQAVVKINVIRSGDLSEPMVVSWCTEDVTAEYLLEGKGNAADWPEELNSAKADVDYESDSGSLEFHPGESELTISIKVYQDDAKELDEMFLVRLSDTKINKKSANIPTELAVAEVIILDDDTMPQLSMAPGNYHDPDHPAMYKVTEGDSVYIKVERAGGGGQRCECLYMTCMVGDGAGAIGTPLDVDQDGFADEDGAEYGLEGCYDFVSTRGTLVFDIGECVKFIEVKTIMDEVAEKDEVFLVSIAAPKNCVLGKIHTAAVTIKNDDEALKFAEKVMQSLNLNRDNFALGKKRWVEQFRSAFEWNNDADLVTKLVGVLTMPWKFVFATVPPASMCGGWLCFVFALIAIGMVTALIGDLAAMFGCSVGLKDSITAITVVALGTSLPDAFASKAAAIGDKSADAALTNVTGSNSVNVFLGLGLPWFMASLYWAGEGATPAWKAKYPVIATVYPGGGFVVQSGDLGYSVSVFIIGAVTCLGGLLLRRAKVGAELGGAMSTPTALFFVALWGGYITLSVIKDSDPAS